LGGATHFTKNPTKWKQIFLNVINGQTKNVYSKADRILHLFSVSELQLNPIGRNPIKFGSEPEEEQLVQNFDITKHIISSQ
jgi:hypothetical protein